MALLRVLMCIVSIFCFATAHTQTQTIDHPEWKTYFDQYLVDGSLILYDLKQDKYHVYNSTQLDQFYTPASTFKIFNSLVGLETGVIIDENFLIPWDKVQRQNPNWNQDHTLKSAFTNSTVWYYQELARRVGGKQMKYWLDKVGYGNADTTGGIDRFWLTGNLRITPQQQIKFLELLQANRLPFSTKTMNTVKEIMIVADSTNYTIRAKTGWAYQDLADIGWYVGYIETDDNTYFFAVCIQAQSLQPTFAMARTVIADSIFNKLNLIKK